MNIEQTKDDLTLFKAHSNKEVTLSMFAKVYRRLLKQGKIGTKPHYDNIYQKDFVEERIAIRMESGEMSEPEAIKASLIDYESHINEMTDKAESSKEWADIFIIGFDGKEVDDVSTM